MTTMNHHETCGRCHQAVCGCSLPAPSLPPDATTTTDEAEAYRGAPVQCEEHDGTHPFDPDTCVGAVHDSPAGPDDEITAIESVRDRQADPAIRCGVTLALSELRRLRSPRPSSEPTEGEYCLLCMRTRAGHGSPPHDFASNVIPPPARPSSEPPTVLCAGCRRVVGGVISSTMPVVCGECSEFPSSEPVEPTR